MNYNNEFRKYAVHHMGMSGSTIDSYAQKIENMTQYVIEKIDRLNCPTWQKLELLQAVIDTTKGTYKPKEHQKPGWQPSR